MPKEIEFEGVVHEFPDDFTDDDIAAALGAGSPAPTSPAITAKIGPRQVSLFQRGVDAVRNAEGLPGVAVGAVNQGINSLAQAGDMVRAGWNMLAPESMEVDRPAQRIDDIPAMNQWQQVGQRGVQAAEIGQGVKALRSVPGLVKRVAGVSKLRAATNLDEAAAAAKGAVVDTSKLATDGLRYRQLAAAGGRPTGAVTKLLRRIDTGDDLPFEEARDFYSNISRLSANEFNSLNPTMQRQVGQIRAALDEALKAAADTRGVGDQYRAGMSEYARSAKAAQRWEELKPALMKLLRRGGEGVAAATGAGAAYKAFFD